MKKHFLTWFIVILALFITTELPADMVDGEEVPVPVPVIYYIDGYVPVSTTVASSDTMPAWVENLPETMGLRAAVKRLLLSEYVWVLKEGGRNTVIYGVLLVVLISLIVVYRKKANSTICPPENVDSQTTDYKRGLLAEVIKRMDLRAVEFNSGRKNYHTEERPSATVRDNSFLEEPEPPDAEELVAVELVAVEESPPQKDLMLSRMDVINARRLELKAKIKKLVREL